MRRFIVERNRSPPISGQALSEVTERMAPFLPTDDSPLQMGDDFKL